MVLLAGAFVAVAGVAGDAVLAQETPDHFHFPSGVGATVSVATLRVPEKAWKHFDKAQDALDHNRLAESDRETAKAIAIAPDFAAAYLLRADSELRANSYAAAVADVKEARRVEPDLMWSGIVLAGAYNGMRQYEDARLVLSRLHGPEAQSWQAAYERARTATGLNDVDGALHWSAVAVDSAPEKFLDVLLLRSNALVKAKRWTDAQTELELYLQLKGTVERRADVVATLERVKGLAREDELQKVASR